MPNLLTESWLDSICRGDPPEQRANLLYLSVLSEIGSKYLDRGPGVHRVGLRRWRLWDDSKEAAGGRE